MTVGDRVMIHPRDAGLDDLNGAHGTITARLGQGAIYVLTDDGQTVALGESAATALSPQEAAMPYIDGPPSESAKSARTGTDHREKADRG